MMYVLRGAEGGPSWPHAVQDSHAHGKGDGHLSHGRPGAPQSQAVAPASPEDSHIRCRRSFWVRK